MFILVKLTSLSRAQHEAEWIRLRLADNKPVQLEQVSKRGIVEGRGNEGGVRCLNFWPSWPETEMRNLDHQTLVAARFQRRNGSKISWWNRAYCSDPPARRGTANPCQSSTAQI